MSNNTPSAAELLHVYNRYIGCDMEYKNRAYKLLYVYPRLQGGVMLTVDNDGEFGADSTQCTLLLRPLSSMTAEEAREIARIVFDDADKSEWVVDPFLVSAIGIHEGAVWGGKRDIALHFGGVSVGGDISAIQMPNPGYQTLITQYLHRKGFDLPQYELGGKTPTEAGLAKYRTNE
jgi:hypothetical protein